MSSQTSRTSSSSEKDFTGAQREKRLAPQPPGKKSHSTKPSEDVRAVGVHPDRSPLGDAEIFQSSSQSNTAKETISEGKHSKRQAPARPGSVDDRLAAGHKMAAETPSQGFSEEKREPRVHSINPFEEDENEEELTVKSDTAANAGLIQWPRAADKDVAPAAKIKPRKARAPLSPAQTAAASAGGDDWGPIMSEDSGRGSSDPKPQPGTLQNTPEKKQGPPATSRR